MHHKQSQKNRLCNLASGLCLSHTHSFSTGKNRPQSSRLICEKKNSDDRSIWKLDIDSKLIGVCGTLIRPFGGSSRYVIFFPPPRKQGYPIFFTSDVRPRSAAIPF